MAVPALLLLAGCGADAEVPASGAITDATQTPVLTATPLIESATATPSPGTASAEATADPSRLEVSVSIDARVTHPISPFIYGVADATSGNDDTLQWLGATLARWGGSSSSTFNWENNSANPGALGQFKNIKQGDDTPGSASLAFVTRNTRLGLLTNLTIPTTGWVAKDGSSQSLDVPQHGGPAVASGSDTANTVVDSGVWSQPYDPSANRARTSVQSLPEKGAPFKFPPDLTDSKVYQDEWVTYLKATAPKSTTPVLYSMDNEPELWADNTHVDIRPVRTGYDDELANFLSYARAVKKADPSGLVAGPESWGVTGYMYSALDEGGDDFLTAADHAAHGDLSRIEWFLQSVADSDKKAGSRSLDVLTLHYSLDVSGAAGGNDSATPEERVQAPRGLWDGLFTVPGWVSRTEWGNLALLTRMQEYIDARYPGTRLGLSEWDFGGQDDISGAMAAADALGIFGRQNLYMAAYKGLPAKNSPLGWAFRLYRNYDGKGAHFGDSSVQTVSSNTELFSAYGGINDAGTTLTMMLINKDAKRNSTATLKPQGFTPTLGRQYLYDGSQPDGPAVSTLTIVTPDAVQVTVPPMSISLVELSAGQK